MDKDNPKKLRLRKIFASVKLFALVLFMVYIETVSNIFLHMKENP